MLSRQHRLAATSDIQLVVRSGQLLRTPWVKIYYLTKPNQPASRVACVVGKKVHTRAIIRHHYQRWLRAISRSLLGVFSTPHDIVLVAQPAVTAITTIAERSAAQGHIRQLLDKVVTTSDN